MSFGPVTELFDIAKNASRDTQFMQKLLSSLVLAMLIKIVKCVDPLNTLDRKTQDPYDTHSCPKSFHRRRRAFGRCSKQSSR